MEVNGISSSAIGAAASDHRSAVRKPESLSEEVSFRASEAISRALEETPAVRLEEVERGLALYKDVQYPPRELIDGLSRLLADRFVGQ